MAFEIRQISATQTWPLRHLVLWPNQPLAYVQLRNDHEGKHYGLFVEQQLVSIISLFTDSYSVQFRKFATLTNFQGKGYGGALFEYVIEMVKKEGFGKVWCNARIDKTGFYRKFGMVETKAHFCKGEIDYIIMEKNLKREVLL